MGERGAGAVRKEAAGKVAHSQGGARIGREGTSTAPVTAAVRDEDLIASTDVPGGSNPQGPFGGAGDPLDIESGGPAGTVGVGAEAPVESGVDENIGPQKGP